jgi:hypothetical protein
MAKATIIHHWPDGGHVVLTVHAVARTPRRLRRARDQGGAHVPRRSPRPRRGRVVSVTPTDPLVIDLLEAEIASRKAKYDRMPKHWEARRIEAMRDIEQLIDQWLALRCA